jgi:hypothetical protein
MFKPKYYVDYNPVIGMYIILKRNWWSIFKTDMMYGFSHENRAYQFIKESLE